MKLPASESDPCVLGFLNLWNLKDPIYLDFEDKGYVADFCHVSAKHMVLKNGGSRIHGWALWLFERDNPAENTIVGDFHSVWADAEGTLHDVTPPKMGNRVLFVRDPTLTITQTGDVQQLYNNRTDFILAPRIRDGKPTNEDRFDIPNNRPDLVAYCKRLCLPDTSML